MYYQYFSLQGNVPLSPNVKNSCLHLDRDLALKKVLNDWALNNTKYYYLHFSTPSSISSIKKWQWRRQQQW